MRTEEDLDWMHTSLASLAQDGTGKGLACSLTATLENINSDIDSFRETYQDIQVLIFYTPAKVTNQTAEKWASTVYDKLGCCRFQRHRVRCSG